MTDHARNIGPIWDCLGCGAITRAGTPCEAPAVTGKQRCRMHGRAAGSGAPRGHQNALKDGLHTREAIEQRKAVRTLLKKSRRLLDEMG